MLNETHTKAADQGGRSARSGPVHIAACVKLVPQGAVWNHTHPWVPSIYAAGRPHSCGTDDGEGQSVS